jgi:hypothetical protein
MNTVQPISTAPKDGVFVDAEVIDEQDVETAADEVPEHITDEEWERFQESQRREFRMGKAEHDRERSKDGE